MAPFATIKLKMVPHTDSGLPVCVISQRHSSTKKFRTWKVPRFREVPDSSHASGVHNAPFAGFKVICTRPISLSVCINSGRIQNPRRTKGNANERIEPLTASERFQNRLKDFHHKTAHTLWSRHDDVIIPKFGSRRTSSRANSRLRNKTVRQMLCLGPA